MKKGPFFILLVLLIAGAGGVYYFATAKKDNPKPNEIGNNQGHSAAPFDFKKAYERWSKQTTTLAGSSPEALQTELVQALRTASTPLIDEDQKKIAAWTSDDVSADKLLEIDLIRGLLQAQENRKEHWAYTFLNESDRIKIAAIMSGRESTPDRIIQEKRHLSRISISWNNLRQAAKDSIPAVLVPNQPLLKFLREATSENYHDSRLTKTPTLPLFSSQDSQLVGDLQRFFQSNTMKEAFPIDLYPRLYENGKVLILPYRLDTYQERWREAIATERAKVVAGKSPEDQVKIEKAYIALESLLETISIRN